MSVNDNYINMRSRLDKLVIYIKSKDLYSQDIKSTIDLIIQNSVNTCNSIIDQTRLTIQDMEDNQAKKELESRNSKSIKGA